MPVDAHGVSYLTDEDVYDDPRTGHLVHILSSVPCGHKGPSCHSFSIFPFFFLSFFPLLSLSRHSCIQRSKHFAISRTTNLPRVGVLSVSQSAATLSIILLKYSTSQPECVSLCIYQRHIPGREKSTEQTSAFRRGRMFLALESSSLHKETATIRGNSRVGRAIFIVVNVGSLARSLSR